MRTHGIDYFVHGDDPCIVNGRDVYEVVRRLKRFVSIPRTEGISTTDIVGRLLVLTKDHHTAITEGSPTGRMLKERAKSTKSQFLVTSNLLQAFNAALPVPPAESRRIVYV